uniref:Uncharacterized protein n=1 Tax=Molossus molossus TaxID=27622 RepID=A0A7J8F9A5_MOLMO|nr:hypothetical protein HJG59_008470 [Molossus molossus]
MFLSLSLFISLPPTLSVQKMEKCPRVRIKKKEEEEEEEERLKAKSSRSELWISEVNQFQAGAHQSSSPTLNNTSDHYHTPPLWLQLSMGSTFSFCPFQLLLSFSLDLTISCLFPHAVIPLQVDPLLKSPYLNHMTEILIPAEALIYPDTHYNVIHMGAFIKIKLKPNIPSFLSCSVFQ